METSMSTKFEKYWKKSCTTLAVASFLDPRYKKRLVEFYMKKFHGNAYQVHVDEFVRVIKNLYQFYVSSAPSSSRAKTKSTSVSAAETNIVDLLADNEDDELESYLYESSGPDGDDLNELAKYMTDPPLRYTGQFDILSWWKNQISEYPILCQIARDLLAVQVSTVALKSTFSAGGCVIDPFRSRLDPEMVEALICTKDWVAAARKDRKVGSIVGDLEVLEAIASKLAPELIAMKRWRGPMRGIWTSTSRTCRLTVKEQERDAFSLPELLLPVGCWALGLLPFGSYAIFLRVLMNFYRFISL